MTRYAIRRQDGRFLTSATFHGAEIWIWLLTPDPETTFASQIEAFTVIWGPATAADVGCSDPWTVIPVLEQEARP